MEKNPGKLLIGTYGTGKNISYKACLDISLENVHTSSIFHFYYPVVLKW